MIYLWFNQLQENGSYVRTIAYVVHYPSRLHECYTIQYHTFCMYKGKKRIDATMYVRLIFILFSLLPCILCLPSSFMPVPVCLLLSWLPTTFFPLHFQQGAQRANQRRSSQLYPVPTEAISSYLLGYVVAIGWGLAQKYYIGEACMHSFARNKD